MKAASPVMIIAEAGVNHNGSLDLALQLVEAAAAAGADAVKFQTWKTENVITVCAPKADYQLETTGMAESQFAMLKKLELPYADFLTIKKHCEKHQILFLSTADEIESAEFLAPLLPFFKVGSAELTDLPFLRKLAHFGKDLILSTGMATLDEVEVALSTLEAAGLPRQQVVALHCHTDYPTACRDVNLRAMLTMREQLKVRVGYSDHTLGIEIPVAAVALGAEVIEKHFTLDRALPGPDHTASLDAGQLKDMVAAIRHVELALGDGVKRPSERELRNRPAVRKSIVASRQIEPGEMLSAANLTVKRPGTGISPLQWDLVLGRKATRPYALDEEIEP